MCQGCSHQGTVSAGTIFDKTRTPLRVWLAGAWYLTNLRHGVSALGLQRVLGLGSRRPCRSIYLGSRLYSCCDAARYR